MQRVAILFRVCFWFVVIGAWHVVVGTAYSGTCTHTHTHTRIFSFSESAGDLAEERRW